MTATTSRDAIELVGLPPEALEEEVRRFFRETGEPDYRVEQVKSWVWRHRARWFGDATNLSLELREELDRHFSLTPLEVAWEAHSVDGTVKHLWQLDDGEQVESVLIPTVDRLTLCLSSQAGCALGCRFCATGYFGFRRQLRSAEIVAQYRESARLAEGRMDRPITNVVYMGMGEPLANVEAVLDSLRALHGGFGLGARRLTVSTVGLVPGILRLAERPEPFGLAVSLHAPTHELRSELMPVERRHPLPELMEAVRRYQAARGRRVSFEYTLIRGINDAPELAEALADLLADLTCFVNLIPFNPIPDRPEWGPSPPDRIRSFARILHRRGISAAVREPRGRDIAAACGQLRLERAAAG